MPSTVQEALRQSETLKCKLRVLTLYQDTLAPYLDVDVGKSKQLEANDCYMISHVPKELLYDMNDDLVAQMEKIRAELEALLSAPLAGPSEIKPTTEKKSEPKKRAAKKSTAKRKAPRKANG